MVAFEKMEAVRYANFLKPQGVAVINDYEIASATIAAGQCSAKCMNIVLFGAMTHVLKLEQIDWEDVIRDTVPPKFLELNLQALSRRSGGRQKAVKAYKKADGSGPRPYRRRQGTA